MDVIIIGAGAAGLAAARHLARNRIPTLVLEARDRIGGRCWTRHEPGSSMPIEYGAEFIHGRPAVTFRLLRAAGMRALERAGTRWFVKRGSLAPSDRTALLAEIHDAMTRTRAPRTDISFAAYLEHRLGKRLSAEARTAALRMVEGYDAADPHHVSARSIIDEWTSESAGSGVSYRPPGGYGALLGHLAAQLEPAGARVQLHSIVRAVTWRRGRVVVEGSRFGRPFREQADKAIVTLPLGVLQQASDAAGSVSFLPALAQKRGALAGLVSGPALKVILRFRADFWQGLDEGRYRHAGFFQAPEASFPTFWTTYPVRSPLLVAWAGGPRAGRLCDLEPARIIRQALVSAGSLFGRCVSIERELAAAYVHDWQRDPYARGAYSYLRAGALTARRQLAAPVQDTLYFAGEAADFEGETGTVAGALQSGMRAAREALAARGRL